MVNLKPSIRRARSQLADRETKLTLPIAKPTACFCGSRHRLVKVDKDGRLEQVPT